MMKNILPILAASCLFFCTLLSDQARAATVQVTVGDLDTAIEQMPSNPEAFERLVLSRIQEAINEADLQLDAGSLIFTDTSRDLVDDNSCTRTEVRTVTTTATLASDTTLALSLSSLNEPLVLSLNIMASVEANGRAKQTIGIRVGSCQTLAEDNFSFKATGNLELSLTLTLNLNPELDTYFQRLVLRPVIELDGDLIARDVRVDVDDSILRKVLEGLLEDELESALDQSEMVKAIARLQLDLEQTLAQELDDGSLVIELPSADDEQVSKLYTLLSPQGDFSLSLGFLRTKRVELLAALVTGDDEKLSELLSNAAICEAAGILQTSLDIAPVYTLAGNGCDLITEDQLRNNTASLGTVYTDAQCLQSFDYFDSSEIDYCTTVLDVERLGNAAADTQTLDRWTLSPGTRFDIGALPLAGLTQPFTQRVNYKQVDTAQGTCELEMRIHTVQPDTLQTASLTPLIAYHGGSWQRRSSGALGIESLATVFANAGYVVFAPFYRLLGTEEGNVECNNADLSAVLSDASDAIDWVQSNAASYGATGKPVLFGQSAGGHMAAVMAVERPSEIEAAIAFYAPTDFEFFAQQILSGEIDSATGRSILETVVGQTVETLDINAPLIQRNTLTKRVMELDNVPPFFLLHGKRDTVLPFNQSVRLCNALAGNVDNGPASPEPLGSSVQDPLKRVVQCDFNGSELHLITEGEHALDLCIAEELCLAGSPQSAQKTRESVERMLGWLQQIKLAGSDNVIANDAAPVAAADAAQTSDSVRIGGGSLSGLSLWFLCMFVLRTLKLFPFKESSNLAGYRRLIVCTGVFRESYKTHSWPADRLDVREQPGCL